MKKITTHKFIFGCCITLIIIGYIGLCIGMYNDNQMMQVVFGVTAVIGSIGDMINGDE